MAVLKGTAIMVDSPTPQPTPSPSAAPAPAAEQWNTRTANGDLTQEELSRRRELSEAQSKAYVEKRMQEAGIGGAPLERIGGRFKSTYEMEDDGGYDPVEALRQNQTLAQRSNETQQAMAQIEQAKGEVDKQIQEQTNSVNFYILQFATDLFAFDVSCFGLLLPLTLPIYDFLIVPILGYELYNAWTGNASLIPYFPKLSWQSFLKPGGGGDASPIPLPETPLLVLVFVVILILGLLTLIEGALIAAIIYAWNNPSEAGAMLSGFLGMPSIPGL